MASKSSSILFVEGRTDIFIVQDLLRLHGVPYSAPPTDYHSDILSAWKNVHGESSEPPQPKPLPDGVPLVKACGDVTKVLKIIEAEIQFTERACVGFILDADTDCGRRWEAVADRLRNAGVPNVPERAQPNGFRGQLPETGLNIGVWLMPDNRRAGISEDFLRDMVPDEDKLIWLAEGVVSEAMRAELRFPEVHRSKAVIYTWLAWQEETGLPYGQSLRKKYFRHESPAALAFVAWFRNLYGLPANP